MIVPFVFVLAMAGGDATPEAEDGAPFNYLVDQRPSLTEPTMFALVTWGGLNVVAGPLGVLSGVGDAVVYAHGNGWLLLPDGARAPLYDATAKLDVASTAADLAAPLGGGAAAIVGAVVSDRPVLPVVLAIGPGTWLAVLGFMASLDPSSREPSVTAAVRFACDRASGPALVGVLALASSVGWFDREPTE